jgi:aminomethyltransferase
MESVITPIASELRKTPLNGLHRRLGARMVNFAGWDMPVEYPATGGLIAEHKAVRAGVGVFDVSHMGDIRIHTAAALGGALAAVQHLSMNDAAKLAIGQAHYSALLYPAGTFVDDVVVHRLGEDDFLFVINAGTREKDISWVLENTKGLDCAVEDLSDAYTQLAIQGPHCVEVMKKLTDVNLDGIKNYWFTHGTVCGLPGRLIARTGYTGEDGFEIYVPGDVASSESVWNAVMEAGKEFGILPCGLGARNTLRLEAKMALYGHEISEKINVWEAGLDRYCKMDKPEFIGRAALAKASAAGLKRELAGLQMMERGIARDEYKVFDAAGEEVGVITSGSPSPTLGANIALAYVPPALAALGTSLFVGVRTQRVRALVVPTPFYKRVRKTTPQAVASN